MRLVIDPRQIQPGDHMPDLNGPGPEVLDVGEPQQHSDLGEVVPLTVDGEADPRLVPVGAEVAVERDEPAPPVASTP